MIIQELSLYQYRNYLNENFSFSPGLNVIIGDNAQGKTNLIESIYLLSGDILIAVQRSMN